MKQSPCPELQTATPAVRFDRSVSYRARVLRQGPFPATSLVFLQPTYPPKRDCGHKEILAATVTPERAHLLETGYFLTAALLYRHCSHL